MHILYERVAYNYIFTNSIMGLKTKKFVHFKTECKMQLNEIEKLRRLNAGFLCRLHGKHDENMENFLVSLALSRLKTIFLILNYKRVQSEHIELTL